MNLEEINLNKRNMDNIIFKNKYLKYKKKYNILKNLLGGEDPIIKPPGCSYLVDTKDDTNYSQANYYNSFHDTVTRYLLYNGKYKAIILLEYQIDLNNSNKIIISNTIIYCNDGKLYFFKNDLPDGDRKELLSFSLPRFNYKNIKFKIITIKPLYLIKSKVKNDNSYSLHDNPEKLGLYHQIISYDSINGICICTTKELNSDIYVYIFDNNNLSKEVTKKMKNYYINNYY